MKLVRAEQVTFEIRDSDTGMLLEEVFVQPKLDWSDQDVLDEGRDAVADWCLTFGIDIDTVTWKPIAPPVAL